MANACCCDPGCQEAPKEPCGEATHACCLPDGCIDLPDTEAGRNACLQLGGTWSETNRPCGASPCGDEEVPNRGPLPAAVCVDIHCWDICTADCWDYHCNVALNDRSHLRATVDWMPHGRYIVPLKRIKKTPNCALPFVYEGCYVLFDGEEHGELFDCPCESVFNRLDGCTELNYGPDTPEPAPEDTQLRAPCYVCDDFPANPTGCPDNGHPLQGGILRPTCGSIVVRVRVRVLQIEGPPGEFTEVPQTVEIDVRTTASVRLERSVPCRTDRFIQECPEGPICRDPCSPDLECEAGGVTVAAWYEQLGEPQPCELATYEMRYVTRREQYQGPCAVSDSVPFDDWPSGSALVFDSYGPFSEADGCTPGCLRMRQPNPTPPAVSRSRRCQRCDPAVTGEFVCPGERQVTPCQRFNNGGDPIGPSQCCGDFPLDERRPDCQNVPLYCVAQNPTPDWIEPQNCPPPDRVCFDDGSHRPGVSAAFPMRSGFDQARIAVWRID